MGKEGNRIKVINKQKMGLSQKGHEALCRARIIKNKI